MTTEKNDIRIESDGGAVSITGSSLGSRNKSITLGDLTSSIEQTSASDPRKEIDYSQKTLKELIVELSNSIKDSNDLSEEDKQDLLEQVTILSKCSEGNSSIATENQSTVRKATKIFKATLSVIPVGANIVTICEQLIPLITKAISGV